MLEMGMTFGFGQLVIDDEIAGMVKRVVSGMSVDDEVMGVDLIKKVGIGGDFLTQRHSLKYVLQEQSQPRVLDRRMRGAWEKRGSKDLLQVANERARELLRTHKPLPLPEGVEEEIKRIVASAE